VINRNRGVSEIIAVLLLIVIAVAAAVITYGFIMGFIGGTTSTSPSAQTKMVIEAVLYHDNYSRDADGWDNLTIWIRNLGPSSVNVTAVYVYAANGTGMVYSNTSLKDVDTYIQPGMVVEILVNDTKINLGPGTYYVKVTTEEGVTAISEAFTVG